MGTLHLKRDITGLDQNHYKKKKSFLMFKWNFLFFSSCTLPFFPSLDTTDANLSTAEHHLFAHAAGTSDKSCTERSGSIHQRKQQNRAIKNLLPDPKVRKIKHLCCYWLNYRQQKSSDLIKS